MTARTAKPLPECGACRTPTRREKWLANGGLCTDCKRRRDFAQLTLVDD